jgi:flagellar motor switch protein FliG
MGVYSRYKRDPGGFRTLVELMEVTPKVRREKMIEVGMKEDPEYTTQALRYLMTFEDIVQLPDLELTEVLSKVPPRFTALAVSKSSEKIQERFLKMAPPRIAGKIRDCLNADAALYEVGGAQLKLVSAARELEKLGHVKTKHIPLNVGTD